MSNYCFAYRQGRNGRFLCVATTMSCDGKDEQCPFFRTREDYKQSCKASLERIAALPPEHQLAIYSKYHKEKREDDDSMLHIIDIIGVV